MKNNVHRYYGWLYQNHPEIHTLLQKEAWTQPIMMVQELMKDAVEEGVYTPLLSLECGVVVLEAMIEYYVAQEEYEKCSEIRKLIDSPKYVIWRIDPEPEVTEEDKQAMYKAILNRRME